MSVVQIKSGDDWTRKRQRSSDSQLAFEALSLADVASDAAGGDLAVLDQGDRRDLERLMVSVGGPQADGVRSGPAGLAAQQLQRRRRVRGPVAFDEFAEVTTEHLVRPIAEQLGDPVGDERVAGLAVGSPDEIGRRLDDGAVAFLRLAQLTQQPGSLSLMSRVAPVMPA